MARKTKESEEQNEIMASDQQGEVSNPEASQVEYGAQYRSRCGGALRAARENQGLSIPDVASRLRLSLKQIEAIEADNFAALPEPTIVRGFIRNYAKQLKINAEPLLDAYNVIVPSANPHDLIVKPSANMKMTSYKKPNTGRNLLLGLLALAGLGTWLFYQNFVEKPSPTLPSASLDSAEPLPEAALPAAERAPELQATTELTLPPADTSISSNTSSSISLPAATASPQPADSNASNAVAVVAPLPVEPTVAPAVPAVEPTTATVSDGASKLEISASQETWVNVIDASGREVYSKTIFAGSRESIDVKPPINVTVGNAGATSMNFNGKSVELAPYSRNNVAHIKLE
jgi:cytoskeleton protein RodZ